MEEKKLQGRIVKGIAGFYYVDTGNGDLIECRAKGIFRKERIKPLVGDFVEIELLDEENAKGSLIDIGNRKNQLIRPEVANVDQAFVIFAHSSPQPNLNLLDKFLIMMEKNGIPAVLCFNKEDLVSEEQKKQICAIYEGAGITVLSLRADRLEENDRESDSAGEAVTRNDIRELLKDKLTVLAGPSGVGKSTFVNAVCQENKMQTGDISRKLERGRHTTRHSELFEISPGTYMMDTPGFTAFELDPAMEKEEVKVYYPEFYEYEGKCKFPACTHTHEPGCAVKDAVEKGRINKIRYEGYVSIFEELKSRRKYDRKNYIRNT